MPGTHHACPCQGGPGQDPCKGSDSGRAESPPYSSSHGELSPSEATVPGLSLPPCKALWAECSVCSLGQPRRAQVLSSWGSGPAGGLDQDHTFPPCGSTQPHSERRGPFLTVSSGRGQWLGT